jgi:hypothetical protein
MRKAIPKSVEKDVLVASRRRCCLCVYLKARDEVQKGQIAHLNGDPSNWQFDNLVYLCLEHHDEYDGKTSQSKGLTQEEVREYRSRLYTLYRDQNELGERVSQDFPDVAELSPLPESSQYERLRNQPESNLGFITRPWRYPLWQTANESEFFAYKAGNGADGVCLIERIDLPDGRIVIVAIETTGNPGNSITNCVEELCFQVCARFDIPAENLVWLEHYDYYDDNEWNMVTFGRRPPDGPFEDPKWIKMTPHLWRDLRLKPKKKLPHWRGDFYSKVTKLFHWPTEALL